MHVLNTYEDSNNSPKEPYDPKDSVGELDGDLLDEVLNEVQDEAPQPVKSNIDYAPTQHDSRIYGSMFRKAHGRCLQRRDEAKGGRGSGRLHGQFAEEDEETDRP